MNTYSALGLKAARKVFTKLGGSEYQDYTDKLVQVTGEDAYHLLKDKMGGTEPAMVARFGNVEMHCLLHYHAIHQKGNLASKTIKYLKGESFPFWWDAGIARVMTNNAGFINPSPQNLEKFCERMLLDMKEVDVLGSWLSGEKVFEEYMPGSTRIRIRELAPWYYKDPWTEILENKRVLVVHPYEKSILAQFKKRPFLFPDKRILPPYQLETVKAVQSIAHNKTPFNSWFDALHYMEDEIAKKDFDLAIIGCGAYGFPLAAHIKRMGKRAMNLGGVTQVLFGVKGKRWEDHNPEGTFFNEHWKSPYPEEIPQNFKNVEGGCYW